MKIRIFIIVIMAALVSIGISCQEKQSFRSVSVEEFKEFINDSSVILIDVRTSEEFNEGHITDTDFNIDILENDFDEKASQLLPEGSSLAIYCRSGNRSKTAAARLSKAGYKVTELAAGYRGWTESGESVSKP